MSYTKQSVLFAFLVYLVSLSSFAAMPLAEIQTSWANCQYQVDGKDQKVACFETLIAQNEQAVSQEPANYDKQVWLAINLSSLAGSQGGMGALSLVKRAKVILQDVIEKKPETLDGSAYTSLGSLYYQVPGWPIGFGSDKKAEANLKKALEINPHGIDANYFYADFLMQDGRKAEAKHYFDVAMAAPARAGRASADEGRRMEIRNKLEELNK